MNRRRQLTLYIPGDDAREIEKARSVVDPVQHRLIAAHVTLCRENELGDLAALRTRRFHIPFGPLHLGFGTLEAFSGKGEIAMAVQALKRMLVSAMILVCTAAAIAGPAAPARWYASAAIRVRHVSL